MHPTGTTTPKPDPNPEACVPYPHRIGFVQPHKHGIVLGHEREYTALTKWVRAVAPRRAAKPVALVAEALASNAHKHTRSGDPGGTVRVVVDTNPFLIGIAVTDNGPRRDTVIPYPRLGEPRLAPLPGLHLVDQLALYWEWDWEWKGTAMGPLTIRAVVENP
ncbi:ATP-binding protein [Nocardiopsis sp. NPDC058631]|uniref:ATP-binding protein n=1 Tax=Nocardiopsis sp. NPDC058631 TaxID=3346566 RepID=UPI0036525280